MHALGICRSAGLALLVVSALTTLAVAQRVPDLRLNSQNASGSEVTLPRIAASGSSVYVTWEDGRHGGLDIYFNRSIDGGGTWGPEQRLDTGSPAGRAESIRPQIAASGSLVCVVWQDARNGPP